MIKAKNFGEYLGITDELLTKNFIPVGDEIDDEFLGKLIDTIAYGKIAVHDNILYVHEEILKKMGREDLKEI